MTDLPNTRTSEGNAAVQAVERLPLARYRVDYTVPDDSFVFKASMRLLQRCLGGEWAARVSKEAHESLLPDEGIWTAYMRVFGIESKFRGVDIGRIPKTGPLVVVSNHPTGPVDGFVIGSLIERHVRPDMKFLIVPRFCNLPGMKDCTIPAYNPSPSGRAYPDADSLLAEARAAMQRHVEKGGAIAIFPTGPATSVAPDGTIVDGNWRHGAFSLAAKTGAKVLPIHLDAPRSPLRVFAHRIHPFLFHATTAQDLKYLRGKPVTVTIGDPDAAEVKDALSDLSKAPERMRDLVYRLPETASSDRAVGP